MFRSKHNSRTLDRKRTTLVSIQILISIFGPCFRSIVLLLAMKNQPAPPTTTLPLDILNSSPETTVAHTLHSSKQRRWTEFFRCEDLNNIGKCPATASGLPLSPWAAAYSHGMVTLIGRHLHCRWAGTATEARLEQGQVLQPRQCYADAGSGHGPLRLPARDGPVHGRDL